MATSGDFDYKAFRKEWDNLLARQKYKDAEKLCHEGLAKSPLDQSRGRLYNHLGYLYENFLDDKTFDDILEHYVLSLQVDESNANSHYNLANFLLEQGMQHLLRALELNPNHGKANKRYANLTPIKANTTLDLGGHKYQVIEVVDDGVRAIRLRKRNDGDYERTDDDPVYVEVSSPEKVHPSSTQKSGRTNTGNSPPQALNIDDSQNVNNYQNGLNKQSCCSKCVLYWWFWALLWIIAIGGVVVPVLGYYMFVEEECIDIPIIESVAANTAATTNEINVLFLTDCNVNSTQEFDQQYTAIHTFLTNISTLSTELDVNYAIEQYCNENINAPSTLSLYNDNTITPDTKDSSSTGFLELEYALRACQTTYNSNSNIDPFICIPFISGNDIFDDPFESMIITANDSFGDIYLSFMVSDTNDNIDMLYATLGSFATGTECMNSDSESYGNTWWDADFYCDDTTDTHHQYCPHCFNYLSTASFECGIQNLVTLFEGDGITKQEVKQSGDQTCNNKYEIIYFYCIGAVIPLLIWVFIVIIVLCCNGCKNRNKRNNMNNQIDNNDQKQQTAYV